MSALSRPHLRRQLRRQRRELPVPVQHACAVALARQFGRHPLFVRSRHVAFYLSNDGELNLQPLLQRAWRLGKTCYLPVLRRPGQGLVFLPYTPTTPLRRNRFGIPEPRRQAGRVRPLWALDLVLTPLVGFDAHGNRLGMGGGYYDRSFAYLRQRCCQCRPRLLGVAYAFQQVDSLPAAPWDVPLWGVLTEHGLRRFPSRHAGL